MVETGIYVYRGKKIARDGSLNPLIKRRIVHGWATLEKISFGGKTMVEISIFVPFKEYCNRSYPNSDY